MSVLLVDRETHAIVSNMWNNIYVSRAAKVVSQPSYGMWLARDFIVSHEEIGR